MPAAGSSSSSESTTFLPASAAAAAEALEANKGTICLQQASVAAETHICMKSSHGSCIHSSMTVSPSCICHRYNIVNFSSADQGPRHEQPSHVEGTAGTYVACASLLPSSQQLDCCSLSSQMQPWDWEMLRLLLHLLLLDQACCLACWLLLLLRVLLLLLLLVLVT